MAQEVDLTQPHGVEKIADGRRVLGDTGARGRRIGIPEARQIRGKD